MMRVVMGWLVAWMFGTAASVNAAEGGVVSDPALENAGENRVEEILVVGQRENRESRGALVLPMSLFETPQAVSVVDAGFIEDFGLDDVNQLLNLVTGVNVEQVETDRTYYNARGFDIKSMQVDGIGLPFNWNVVGALDTYVYDKVEVIRGANGLLTGVGNPSGTINYIRKRPTNDTFFKTEVSAGSWDRKRVEADLSGPLTENGSWAGRLLGAAQSGDSYLDNYENERAIVSGILEGQVGDRATVTFGYTQQNNNSQGVLWGALPMLYDDGTQTEFPRSSSTTQNWTKWDTQIRTGFVEATYAFSSRWNLQTTLTYNDYDEPSKLFYTYGAPNQQTGEGLFGYPGNYHAESDRVLFDSTLSGAFDAFGRTHEVLLGTSISHANEKARQRAAPADDPAWGAMPAFPRWSGNEVAQPQWEDSVTAADWDTDFRRVFGVAHLNVTNALSFILGFNGIDMHSSGFSYGESTNSDDQEISPYVGVTYAITDTLNAYASYSDIYQPQSEFDINSRQLGAAEGTSYEAGLKAEFFERRLLASLSLFRARQDNYAEYAGFNPDTGVSYYAGVDVESEGYELEFQGRITENWSLLAGYTNLELTDPHGGDDVRTFVPSQTFNFGTRYRFDQVPGLEAGTTVKWQDDTHLDNGVGVIRSDAHAVVSGYVGYEFLEKYEIAVNGYNLGNEKYLTSLYWDQSFYAAGSNVTATFRMTL
jgi:outer-membrane receptor for ferric coprogen and ferric-rhodotorulic acid